VSIRIELEIMTASMVVAEIEKLVPGMNPDRRNTIT
jgi:hypothetical protein